MKQESVKCREKTLPNEDAVPASDWEKLAEEHEFHARNEKMCGVFYTPKKIAAFMCRNALNAWMKSEIWREKPSETQNISQELRKIRVLDPACGCGVFLVEMLRLLAEKRRETEPEKDTEKLRAEIICRNLFGWDVDAEAVQIAGMRLKHAPEMKPENENEYRAKFENRNLEVRDALFSSEAGKDSERISERQKYDLILGNPPYEELRDLSPELARKYRESRFASELHGKNGKRLNLFQLFLPLGFELLRPGGVLSMLVPNSLLAEETTRTLRERIFREWNCEICSLDSFPERDCSARRVFENVKMSVCILTLRRGFESRNPGVNGKNTCKTERKMKISFPIRTWNDRDFTQGQTLKILPSRIESLFPETLILPMTSAENLEILEKIRKKGETQPRVEICWHSGEIDVTRFGTKFIHHAAPDSLRVLTGAQVQRFTLTDTPSQGGVKFLPRSVLAELSAGKRTLPTQESLVLQRITGVDSRFRLAAARISAGILCANSVNRGQILTPETDPDFVLGLLNSEVLNFYVKQTCTNANITLSVLSALPLPRFQPETERDAARCVREIREKGLTPEREETLNAQFYALYGLHPSEISSVRKCLRS